MWSCLRVKRQNGSFIAMSSRCYHMIWWALVLLLRALSLRRWISTFYLRWWMIKVRHKEREKRKEKVTERKNSWHNMAVDLVNLLAKSFFSNNHYIKDPVQDLFWCRLFILQEYLLVIKKSLQFWSHHCNSKSIL